MPSISEWFNVVQGSGSRKLPVRLLAGLVEWVLIIPNYCTMFEDSPGFPISVAQIPRLVYHRINPDGALWFSCSLQESQDANIRIYWNTHTSMCLRWMVWVCVLLMTSPWFPETAINHPHFFGVYGIGFTTCLPMKLRQVEAWFVDSCALWAH
jgi:hypothetical protein